MYYGYELVPCNMIPDICYSYPITGELSNNLLMARFGVYVIPVISNYLHMTRFGIM